MIGSVYKLSEPEFEEILGCAGFKKAVIARHEAIPNYTGPTC